MIDIYNNVFYVSNINAIGGIESWLYYIAKIYSEKYNMCLIYDTADVKQINRLNRYIKCIKYNKEKIKCDNAIFCYDTKIIDNIEAKEYIQFIHGDYEKVKEDDERFEYKRHKKITKVYSVSNLARDSVKRAFNVDSKTIYNPVSVDKPRPVLKLISATRLTKEKGYDKMVEFGKILERHNIPYIWYVFTNDKKESKANNMIFLKPTLDITSYIKESDYVVQLSRYESSGYTLEEGFLLGKKAIITDLPAFREIGANKNNSYFFNEEIDIEKIYEDKDREIIYTPPKSNFEKVLIKSKPVYKWRKDMKIKVKVISKFYDMEKKKEREPGEEFITTVERYDYLSGNNAAGIIAVEKIEEIEEEIKKEIEEKTKKRTIKKAK